MARNPLPDSEIAERERIGATLRALRLSQRKPLDDVANRVGHARPYLANLEAGRKRLTPELLSKLADEYGVPVGAIVNRLYYPAAA